MCGAGRTGSMAKYLQTSAGTQAASRARGQCIDQGTCEERIALLLSFRKLTNTLKLTNLESQDVIVSFYQFQ